MDTIGYPSSEPLPPRRPVSVSVLVPAVLLAAVGGRRARDDGGETQGGEEHRQEPWWFIRLTASPGEGGEKMRTCPKTWWFMVVCVVLCAG